MTPEEVVRAEFAAWGRLDIDEIMSHFAPDGAWENVPIRAVTGHDEVRKEIEGFIAGMGSFDAEILKLAVADNVVFTERIDRMDYEGRPIVVRVMGVFELEGDKIKAWREYFDMPKD